eukprot:jgi/Ulvmu1/3298/UM153_0010.1
MATRDDGPPSTAAPSGLDAAVKEVASELGRAAKVSATPQAHGTWRNGNGRELQPAVVQSSDGADNSQAQPCNDKAPNAAPGDSAVQQDATLPPKPGMAHIATDVGASLLRGTPESAPASRPAACCAPRVSCPAAPVPPDNTLNPGPPAAAAAAHHSSRSTGGELPHRAVRHPFQDPTQQQQQQPPSPEAPPSLSLADVARSVQHKHRGFMEALSARESHLGIVRSFWEKGDVRACLAAVHRSGDPALAVDVFRFLRTRDRPQHFRLNMCAAAAAAVQACLRARSDAVAMVALAFLELVLRGFAQDIRTGCAFAERERAPVDIKGDERRQACREARDAFVEVLPRVRALADGKGGPPRALQERAASVADRIDRMVR